MRRYFFILLLLPWIAAAQKVSLVHHGCIHASFPSPRNQYATNIWPFILAHRVATNDVFGSLAGPVFGNVFTGDSFEDNANVTNQFDLNGLGYATIQFTNDIRSLTNGMVLGISDGNHDTDNTNGVPGWCHSANILNPWSAIFPASLFTNQSYYVSNKDAGHWNNTVMKYDNGALKLGFITLHTEPNNLNSNQATLYAPQIEWGRSVMRSDPTRNWIWLAHYFLGRSSNSFSDIVPSYNDHNAAYTNIGPGAAVIDNGLLSEPNLLGFLSSHNIRLYSGIYLTNGTDGHQVFFAQFDQQSSGENPNRMQVLTFDGGSATVSCNMFVWSQNRWCTNYEKLGASTNTFFPDGFRFTFTQPLAIKPPTQLIVIPR